MYIYKIFTHNSMTKAVGVESLKRTLSSRFAGESASVKFQRNSGVQQVRFVSIDTNGAIHDTYRTDVGFDDMDWH